MGAQYDRDELWLGSANLTDRAWDGRNTEAVLHARVVPRVGEGLADGLVKGVATEVPRNALAADQSAEDYPTEQALDRLRNRIAADWDAHLDRDEATGVLRCETKVAPLRVADRAEFSVRLLGQTGWVSWRPAITVVDLPATALHRQTELLELELRSTQLPDLVVSWVARATMHPPIEIARDRAVLARLMGPRAFLLWLRTLLDEVTGHAGDDLWPERPTDQPRQTLAFLHGNSGMTTPTLESVLKAWVRNPATVLQIDRALKCWARDIRATLPEDADEDDREALRQLARFETAWSMIRDGLRLGGTVS